MATGSRYLRRWVDCFDPEDTRTTHRLRAAQKIIRDHVGEPTIVHSDYENVVFGRAKHFCDYRCRAVWPEWVTDELFDAAYAFASILQSDRGAYNRREIEAGRPI